MQTRRSQRQDASHSPGSTSGEDGGAGPRPLRGQRASGATITDTMELPPLSELVRVHERGPRDHFGDRLELAEDLAGMAASLGEVDPRAAERLDDLARSIGSEDGRQRWSDVDLRRAFNTERLAAAYAVRREGGYSTSSIDRADLVRNVLVLIPVLLTWFALAEASRSYVRYIDANPEQVRAPFLLLWQRGFGGEGGPLSPSFFTVALIDAIIILIIVVLTFFTHGRREEREERIERTAGAFQTDMDNVLGEATVVLAADRGSRPAMLAHGLERLADRFEHGSQELLTRLRVEHDRLEQIAGRREREFADFGVFASGMRAGAEETHRLLVELRQVSNGLRTALEDLTSEAGGAAAQQRGLTAAVQSLERLVSSNIQSDHAMNRQLSATATSLAEAADKALSGSEAAAQAGRVATEAVRGIAELASGLVTSQTRVETAIAAEAEANARLADALRSNSGGVAASTKSLQEIGSGLAHLRDEFGRIASQSADQASGISALLREQGTIAAELSQVARDLSAVGIATAQRQREVNEDVAVLLNRLDGLTEILSRTAANAATPEMLQQAFAAALRSELGGQGALTGGTASQPAPARRERSGWPRPSNRS